MSIEQRQRGRAGERGDPRGKPTDQRHHPSRFPHTEIRVRPHRESNAVQLVCRSCRLIRQACTVPQRHLRRHYSFITDDSWELSSDVQVQAGQALPCSAPNLCTPLSPLCEAQAARQIQTERAHLYPCSSEMESEAASRRLLCHIMGGNYLPPSILLGHDHPVPTCLLPSSVFLLTPSSSLYVFYLSPVLFSLHAAPYASAQRSSVSATVLSKPAGDVRNTACYIDEYLFGDDYEQTVNANDGMIDLRGMIDSDETGSGDDHKDGIDENEHEDSDNGEYDDSDFPDALTRPFNRVSLSAVIWFSASLLACDQKVRCKCKWETPTLLNRRGEKDAETTTQAPCKEIAPKDLRRRQGKLMSSGMEERVINTNDTEFETTDLVNLDEMDLDLHNSEAASERTKTASGDKTTGVTTPTIPSTPKRFTSLQYSGKIEKLRSEVNETSKLVETTSEEVALQCTALEERIDKVERSPISEGVLRTIENKLQEEHFVDTISMSSQTQKKKKKKQLKVLSDKLEREVHRQVQNVNKARNAAPVSQALSQLVQELPVTPIGNVFTHITASATHPTAALLHHPAKQWLERLPKFSGKHQENPVTYVTKMEGCMRLSLTSTAYFWWEVAKEKISASAEFQESFVKHFWSPKIQSHVRSQLSQEHWDPRKEKSIEEHFSKVYERTHHLPSPMSDEEFIDLLISQIPVNYQRQFSGNIYRDVSEFWYHLIPADQLERQTRVAIPPRDYDRPRENPEPPLYPSTTNQRQYNNQQRPNHNQNNLPQTKQQKFSQDNGRVNNFAYRGRSSFRQRWNRVSHNNNGNIYDPGYTRGGRQYDCRNIETREESSNTAQGGGRTNGQRERGSISALCPETIIIKVCVIETPVLLDSGAEISCIIPRLRIVGATSRKGPVKTCQTVINTEGIGETKKTAVLVVQKFAKPLILRTDFLTQFGIILHFGGWLIASNDRRNKVILLEKWQVTDRLVGSLKKEYPVLQLCHSPAAAKIRVVEGASFHVILKKDGSVSLCLDARSINWITIKDREAPVQTRNFQYLFQVFPFGLYNAVAEFTRCLDVTPREECKLFTRAYVDDILITSSTFEEHLQHVNKVIQKLKIAGMTQTIKKTAPDKLEAITQLPVPKNVRQLRTFLSVIGFYRNYSNHIARVALPLFKLLKKDQAWLWSIAEQEAFENLKAVFSKDQVIYHLIQGKEFLLYTDASDFALGCRLVQPNGQGVEKTVAMASRTMCLAEKNGDLDHQIRCHYIYFCRAS
ncbi:hypothetical protein PR048_005783 [Dryococelus australis]|uniref:Reverse transcriptase domain-containing protein n=1 Tax=Dryococelus australis TaxID=614101 RepID=A0ABQ9I9Q4_9NEOP|nr:hypothetical protein PR048_005783 [Dryococelus australis]